MTERTIFLNAVEKVSASERTAYLDEVCAGRPALRRRVDELLRSHDAIDSFLDVPAMEQMEAGSQSLAFLGPPGESNSLGRLDYYEILEVVGRGGTGMVLRAKDTKLQRVVAVKVLAPALAASAKARERFVREAQAAAAVRDDHVVAIYAVSDEGPVPYLVMDFIHGITLEERVRHAQGGLELKEILRIGLQVAKGLSAAHAQGLIHRDIKPANILLENSVQRVKITDFGLAGAAADASRTWTGVIAGTPLYMSPEQALGRFTDQRTDLFSLGSVLYTLCTGLAPFRDESSAAVMERVCKETPRPVRELNPAIPKWLEALVARLHAKEMADRPASAQEVADLLSRNLAQLQAPPAETPVVSVTRKEGGLRPRTRRRRFWIAFLLAGLLVALGALILYVGLLRHQQPDDPPSDNPGPIVPLELRREDIPPALLALAGGGDPALAPPELAGVLGDGRFLLPRIGGTAWMQQSPDGKMLAVPLDEKVILFNAQTGEWLRTVKGPGDRIVWVTFSPDSQLLAATTWHEGFGGAVCVWDLRSNETLYTNEVPGPKISGAAAFSPDGACLVTEGDEKLHVWNSRSGQELQILELKPGGVSSMCFSPDGKRLAVAVWHGMHVKLFNWDGKTLTPVRASLGHKSSVGHVAYSPDGQLLASGDDTRFKLWNSRTLEEIRAVETPAGQLAFAPDGRTLFAAHTNDKSRAVHSFTRWDVPGQKELPPLSVEVSASPNSVHHCLSRDGKVLFVAPGRHAVSVKAIDVASGTEMFPRRGHDAPVNTVVVNSNGTTLASAGDDRRVILWDLATGDVRRSLPAHADTVRGLAFSPDCKKLASAGVEGSIALWAVASGAEIWRARGPSRPSGRIQFSPDGRTLVAGTEDGTLKLLAVENGAEAGALRGHAGVVRCVAISPDGKLVASGGEDKTVLLHDLAGGQTQKLRTPNPVNDVAFSPDGRTLAAACDGPDAAVRLWSLETMQETTWHGHAGHVYSLAFSPSAPLLATGGEDGTVRLWDLAASEPRARTIGPGPFGGPVRSVAFTPDGRYLATANANGTVYLLRMENANQEGQTGN